MRQSGSSSITGVDVPHLHIDSDADIIRTPMPKTHCTVQVGLNWCRFTFFFDA